MYQIFADKKIICDSRDSDTIVINPVVTLAVNSAGVFTFTLPPEHPYYNLIERRKQQIEVYRDGEEEPTFSGFCTEATVDFFLQKTIVCEGELSYLNDTIQRQKMYEIYSPYAVRELLQQYIAIHNAQVTDERKFELGAVTVSDPNGQVYCYTNYDSTMQSIKEDLVDDYGGYIRTRHTNGKRIIDYLADSPRTCLQVIRLGENLLDFDTNYDTTDICTVLIPLGATIDEEHRSEKAVKGLDQKLTIESVNGGRDYIVSEAADTFGVITKTCEWSKVTTPEALKRKGEEYLSSVQFEKMNIEAKAVDLYSIGEADQKFQLLDKIRVVSKAHGMDRYFILAKMTLNLNAPEKDTITLGTTIANGLTAKSNKVNADLFKDLEDIQPSMILQSARANASALINSSTGGFVTMVKDSTGKYVEKLVITDTPNWEDATRIWMWNESGFGYANSKDEEGNWEFNLAMTMDGAIVADFVTAGVMSGDRIRGGQVLIGGAGYDDKNQDGTYKNRLVIMDKNNKKLVWFDPDGMHLDGSQVIAWSNVNHPTDLVDEQKLSEDMSALDQKLTKAIASGDQGVKNELAQSVNEKVTEMKVVYYYRIRTAAQNIPVPSSWDVSGAIVQDEWTTACPPASWMAGDNIDESGFSRWNVYTCTLYKRGNGTFSYTPIVGYTPSDVLTMITDDSIMTGTINAVNLTAKHVACEDLTGNEIIGKIFTATNDRGNKSAKMWASADSTQPYNIVVTALETVQGEGGLGNIGCNGYLSVLKNAGINGDLTVSGTIHNSSDARLKHDINELDNEYIKLIDDIEPVSFKMNARDTEHIGFIAQDVQSAIDSHYLENLGTVHENEKGFYSLQYNNFIPILWKGLQDARKRINELEKIREVK